MVQDFLSVVDAGDKDSVLFVATLLSRIGEADHMLCSDPIFSEDPACAAAASSSAGIPVRVRRRLAYYLLQLCAGLCNLTIEAPSATSGVRAVGVKRKLEHSAGGPSRAIAAKLLRLG